jgi:hypothetical protein
VWFGEGLGGSRGLSHVFCVVVVDQAEVGVIELRTFPHQAAPPLNCSFSQAITSLSR